MAPLRYARAAVRHLRAADPILARLIRSIGPCRLEPKPDGTFEALLQSIVYQQLSGKAAQTIHRRVEAALAGQVTPTRLMSTPDDALRAAGLSANKLLAARDLAAKCLSGEAPVRAQLERLTDEEIIGRLVEVRGVGRWTVQMFLMFKLGRPDVLPADDYGIRKAFGLLFRKNGRLPPSAVVARHGARWAPYRTVASWYLWRSLDNPAGRA